MAYSSNACAVCILKTLFQVAVEGNIGCGKTTFLEHFKSNPKVEVCSYFCGQILFLSNRTWALDELYLVLINAGVSFNIHSFSLDKEGRKCFI